MTQVRIRPDPSAPQTNAPPLRVIESGQPGSPRATYDALLAQRRELRSQVAQLESKRLTIAERLRAGNTRGADRAGLEERLTVLDKQIVAVGEKVAAADAAIAQQAAIPGAVVVPPPVFNPNSGPPDGAYAVMVVFTLAVLLPISIAIARRIWRRGAAAVTAMPRELMERLTRLEESVDAVAVEVERIGEGQRFVTNLFVESGAPQMLGAGAMEPIESKQRERVEVEQARRL
jgi:hypothetical protein